jgi:hypothetical protein
MNHQGPPGNHPTHPWFQSQQTPQFDEQYTPFTLLPSYASNTTQAFPSTSYTQDRAADYNDESRVGQQTIARTSTMANGGQITIPLELLNPQSTLQALPRTGVKEIIFLGPSQTRSSIDYFLNSRTVLTTRAIHLLKHLHYLEKVTFSLDFIDLTRILGTLAVIPGMQEIELTLPTASKLSSTSMDMANTQRAFIEGLNIFRHLKRLTIPMEFVTTLLLSHLAILSNLESLTVRYSPQTTRPSSHQQQQQQIQQWQFPVWSSYTADCPGYVFLPHLRFDPRGYFRQLSRLDLGAPLSDASYTILKTLFPKTHIC